MRFVRPARNVQEQNLTLHQKGNAIYFTSIKDVRVKQELKVWYSQDYAQKRCLPSLEQQAAAPSYLSELLDGRLDRSEKCPHCDDYFTKEDLREHIISVHNAPCQAPDPSTKLSPPPSLVKLPSLPLPSLPLLPDVKEEERDEFDRIDFCQKKVRISERIASQKLTPHTVLTSQGSVLTSQGTLLTPQGSVLTSQAGVLTSQGTVLTPPGMSRLVLPRELPAEVMPEAESTPVQEGSTEEDTYLVVSKRKTHECTMCPKVFPKGFNLKRHILSHLPEQRYPCQFCQKNFTQELYRDKHIRNVHSSEDTGVPLLSPPPPSAGEEGWVCEKCAVRFEAADMFLLHMQSHDNDHTMGNDENKLHNQHKSPIHQCPECNDQFMTKDQVLRHIMKAHSHREKHLHVCERCSRAFHSQESLERHIAMANDTNLPFRCVECCKRFSTAIALQGHVRVHGNPSFQCPMCEIQFESLQWMRSHIKTHLVNGVYHCPRCPRKFTEYQVIRKHIRTFHSDRQFACHMCIKVFPSQDKLRMHMLRHSDHREFLCANCGKQFKRKDKLKEHMVRQHNPDENQSKELPAPPPPHPSEEREKKKILPLTNHSGANQSPRPGPGGIGGGGGRSDYAKALYKCHPCLVGFKRRGMLVNHLAARHPDIRPESVPELSMPILKTARDYYCQYCDKIYKSSSKRKSHILKNHPGQALPLSNRMKLGRSDSDELPNPSFCQTVGSISATPQQCQWCHKQYASKAKLLQHQRKKHHEDLPPELRVPRLSKQSSSEDDTSRSGVLPSTSLHPSTSGLNSTHHVDMTSTMQFDVKPDAVLFSATESFTSDSLPKEEPPSSSTPLTRKPSLRPRLMKQDRVQEEDLGEVEQEHMGERALEGGERILEGERILQEGEGGTLVEMGHEVYELTTELCPETLELLRKQFKLDTVGDALGQALEDYTSGKTLTTEQLLKLFALNGVTIVTEQPSDATTNYAVFTPYPPR
ncbi:hypothetical protein M8J77_024075 [Diaphorina citri]|nr:hypothetical protein M8J77_024075 [Diaphorina citri]